jgi:hypothetical protein
MATAHPLHRHVGDTADQVFEFYSNVALTTTLSLTGRTFAGRVERSGDVLVFNLTCTVGSGANSHKVTCTPATGAWTDLERGVTYRYAMWETTSGATQTLFTGALTVGDR